MYAIQVAVRVDVGSTPAVKNDEKPKWPHGLGYSKTINQCRSQAWQKSQGHVCAHNPCRVNLSDSKYGLYGPPLHMQLITCMGPTAAPFLPLTGAPVAEPSSATTAVTVAEQSSTTTAVAAGTPTAGAAPIDNAATKTRCNGPRPQRGAGVGARDSQTQSLDWLHRIRLVRIAEELQTAGVGGIQQVVLHRAIRTLGQGHLHQGMQLCSNPMRKDKKRQRCHRVCAD